MLRMNETVSPPTPSARRSSWPKVVVVLGVLALLVGGAVFVARETIRTPERLAGIAGRAVERNAERLRRVAEAFQQGTVRTEFLSRAVEVEGSTRLQVATLKQGEVFKREDESSLAWGRIPLPKVVVEAQAPVEYSYFVDLAAPWEFRREDDTLLAFPPALAANTPALDVSALNFYTLEGSIWRDESAVREKLREGLSTALKQRSGENANLVRELARQRIGKFVETWLAEKFSDGPRFHVKVIFPDERQSTPDPKSL
jgi:hypothetical protein